MIIWGTCFQHKVLYISVAQEPPALELPGSFAQRCKFCGLGLPPLNQNRRVGAKDLDLHNSTASQVIVVDDQVKNQ